MGTGPQGWPSGGWAPREPGPDRRMVVGIVIGVVSVVLCLAVIGGGLWVATRQADGEDAASVPVSESPAPELIAVTGGITVFDEPRTTGSSCTTQAGYDDIAEGRQVTVTDETGTVLAVADLSEGTAVTGGCMFAFTLSVPPGKTFYGFEVARRGVVRFTEAQVRSGVELSLGD